MSRLDGLKTDLLNNDSILQNIFQFCDVASLKNVRLSCPKWRDLSLESWRDKAMIQLGISTLQKLDLGHFLHYISQESTNPFQLRKRPFKRYSIEFDKCQPGGEQYWERKYTAMAISELKPRHVKIHWEPDYFNGFDELLSVLNSNSLETVEVNWETFWDDIPESIAPQQGSSSNLKCLKLFVRNLSQEHSPARTLWSYLIKSFPNVERLSVGYCTDKRNSIHPADRMMIVKLLKEMRESGNVPPLKQLEMIEVNAEEDEQGDFNEAEIINLLIKCKFPLERLSIHVGSWPGRSDTAILPLLKSYKDTLEFLRASINFNVTCNTTSRVELKHTSRQNVRMHGLKEIVLVNGLERALFLLAHLKIPNLEKLVVHYDKQRNDWKGSKKAVVSFPPGKTYPRLESFELHDNREIPGEKLIQRFARMMPNVTQLTIPVDKISFPVICCHFKGLSYLRILTGQGDYPEVDDEALTGISKWTEVGDGIRVTSRKPNITNLHNLTDLLISGERQLKRDDVKLTQHSVIYGFLELPKLFNLSVALKDLSEDILEMLMSHVKGHLDLQMKPEPDYISSDVDIVSDSENDDPTMWSSSTTEAEDCEVDDDY